MSVGLLAVVDDILAAAMKASSKAAGVVIDDAAVTPQYVHGLSPARELPVVGKIALGSILNKLVVIIPIALLLTSIAPWLLPWLLIAGGAYLCFEGAEKVLEWFGLEHGHHEEEGARDEKKLVFGAIRTDLILSAEIMLISLSNLDPALSFGMRVAALIAIALIMTLAVYGSVALLVKLDDIGLGMVKSEATRALGQRIVDAMPKVFKVISIIGTVAMLWVGGHLLVANLAEVGAPFLYDGVHLATDPVQPAGPVVVWLVDTALSAVVGLIAGLIVVGVVLGIGRLIGKRPSFTEGGRSPHATAAAQK